MRWLATLVFTLALPGVSHAVTPLAAAQARTKPMVENVGAAEALTICQIRSGQWFQTILFASQRAMARDPAMAVLSAADREALNASTSRLHYATRNRLAGPRLENCAALRSSPIIPKLDRLYDEITGGYR